MGNIRLRPGAIAELKKQIEAAIADTVAELDQEYERVIEDGNAFSEEGFSDWDMVDTGRFRDSYKVDVKTTNGVVEAKWIWDPVSPEDSYHYASALYYGFYAFGGKNRWIPGRRWVEKGIQRINPVKSIALKLQQKGIPIRVKRNNVNALDLQ